MVVAKDDFAWEQGAETIATWRKPGHDWQIWFCPSCGSQLPGENDASTVFVPAGLIVDDAPLRVIHHIYVDSKAAWDEIGDAGRQHAGAFTPED